MHDERVIIQDNRRINEKYYRLAFSSKKLSSKVQPGHFLHVRIDDSLDPFLRRPFSYFRVAGSRIEILYEVLGKGTALLAAKPKGTEIEVMGPLGKPFRRDIGKKKRILVAGGVGVPPMLLLAEKWGADALLIGTKSKAEVLPRAELKRARARVIHSTNDGSFGQKGFVTGPLKKMLEAEDPERLYIQTCGPNVMMQAVMDLARHYGVAGQASLEETMACGMGACLGCMADTVDGWVPSCTEGPVFDFERLKVICG